MGYSFDGPTRIITITGGTTYVSVRDLWSRYVDWYLTSDNSKYLPAFYVLGGDDIDPVQGTKIPIYLFCLNSWQIRPDEADHTLTIGDGIMVGESGGDPFLDTLGDYTVRIRYSQPVQAITVATGGGSGGDAPTVSEIVNGVLNTPDSVDTGVDLGSATRTLLTLLPLLTSSDEQAFMIAELRKRFGLDVATPVVHAEDSITAGDDIEITITDNLDGTFTEQRQ